MKCQNCDITICNEKECDIYTKCVSDTRVNDCLHLGSSFLKDQRNHPMAHKRKSFICLKCHNDFLNGIKPSQKLLDIIIVEGL